MDAHERMVQEQLIPRNITDPRVLEAMRSVPRHRFVPQKAQNQAYADCALPIEQQQTISQPYIVALMAQALQLQATDSILEVGTGSGYAAAVLAELGARVVSIERHQHLAQTAADLLDALGYANVQVHWSDGSLGWPPLAPYAAISVPAGAPAVPEPLLDQLAVGGRLVIPVGSAKEQHLVRVRRTPTGFEQQDLGAVRFVPLIGDAGWHPKES